MFLIISYEEVRPKSDPSKLAVGRYFFNSDTRLQFKSLIIQHFPAFFSLIIAVLLEMKKVKLN